MPIDLDDWAVLIEDLDRAVRELASVDAAVWERGKARTWTAGQHVAHVGICLARTAGAFEEAERALRSGSLPPPPARRGVLQSLFVRMVVHHGYMPRGGRTAPWALPPDRPSRDGALEAVRGGTDRHRQLGARLSEAERERLWIANPFLIRWHYRLPEMVRVHAVHTRHHAKQVAEIASLE